ncbi:glycosyltransferase family 2 protein [Armatimonas sp.]|uniref:glycosyltransferase family 2 protein n=1 Tax=Armatimonas sp. TaxID=1872638 RepID=UPI003751F0C9
MSELYSAFTYTCLTVWMVLGTATLGSSCYLAGLMARAALRRKPVQAVTWGQHPPKLIVVIPAHNEELVIQPTLASLCVQSYPRESFELVVIADNCSDTTAALARECGATVLERLDLERRGKGYALEWGIAQLWDRVEKPDAVVVVDADTKAAPDFLEILTRELFVGIAPEDWATHARVLQGRYGVLNGGESWRAALMEGAFELVNHVKPLGRSVQGFTVGLKGNGMGFTRAVLEAVPWSGNSITEDIDYGLDLLLEKGIIVGYAPEALVRAQMPNTSQQAASQRARWERGRYRLLGERAPQLFWAGMKRGDSRLVDAGLDLVVPPLAELAAFHAAWLGLTALCFNMGVLIPVWTLLVPLSLVLYAAYIFGGLRVAGARREVYSALIRAPFYALWKFALYALVRLKRGKAKGNEPLEWVRTERSPMADEPKRPLEDAA